MRHYFEVPVRVVFTDYTKDVVEKVVVNTETLGWPATFENLRLAAENSAREKALERPYARSAHVVQ